MFRKAINFGVQTLKKRLNLKLGTSIVGLCLFQQYQMRQQVQNDIKDGRKQQQIEENKKENQQQQPSVKVEEDAIYLNKHSYMTHLLGNKHENYILVVYGSDNYEDTATSIKTAKHLKKILKEHQKDINVYVISRPTLQDVRQMANRIINSTIFEKEENSQAIEIYIKTTHASDYVYSKWHRESFFTEYKSNKLIKKLDRYINLFENIPQTNSVEQIKLAEQKLADLLQKQYIKLNQPLLIKCASQNQASSSSKQERKDLKFFKNLCFMCVERKLLPLQSKFIILENKEIMNQLNLKEGQIYLLRNDIVQKFENSQEIDQQLQQPGQNKKKLIINDEFMYIPNHRKENGVNQKLHYLAARLESYDTFKNKNQQLLNSIESLTREQEETQKKEQSRKQQNNTQKNEFNFEEMKEEAAFLNFIMPRITFVQDGKFGSIGKLFKKITFAKEKQVLALNLQSDDKQDNHSRLITFYKLYQQYQNNFTFLLADTDQLTDLFPHMDANQSQFSLFNFFNIDKSQSQVGKYYKHLIFPFEKYFLKDSFNFYEQFDELSIQIEKILLERGQRDYVVNQEDMIPFINSDILDNLISNSVKPFLIQILDETPQSRLSQYTLNQIQLERLTKNDNNNHLNSNNEKVNKINDNFDVLSFYRMNHLNQHPFLTGRGNLNGPIYLYVDPSQKQIFLSSSNEQNNKQNSREQLLSFINKCSQTLEKNIESKKSQIHVQEILQNNEQQEIINLDNNHTVNIPELSEINSNSTEQSSTD